MKPDGRKKTEKAVACRRYGRPGKTCAASKEEPKAIPSSSGTITMSVEEMGRELGISRTTAYEIVQQPDFPAFTIGRRVLVSRDGLMKWIEKRCFEKSPEAVQSVEK